MKNILMFNTTVKNAFDNSQENLDDFNLMLFDASHRTYSTFTEKEANDGIRNLFEKISGFDWRKASAKDRRQDFRMHKNEYFNIIEDVIADKMVSGWSDTPFFTQFCDTRNVGLGDDVLFTVEENSLMQVSKFAGNHHDIL